MCGLAAVINGTNEEIFLMGSAIKNRGIKYNITEIDNLKVYFTYLPITDQVAPMQPYRHGEYVVWMNGFISNYKELAIKYKIDLSTNCDTELLSKFIGKGDLSELNGFFSVIIYNTETKKLDCFTDRYGCKQLYKFQRGDTTYISSEVKSLLSVLPLNIDEIGAEDWLYSLGVMNDNTIYEGIQRIPCLPFIKQKEISISYDQAKDRLNFLLQQSINRNKVYGLKDGVFLSGGVDSGILAKRLNPDYCFSMDYQDKEFSEGENIKHNSSGIHLSMICNRDLFEKYKHEAVNALDDLKAGSCYTNFALTELASKFCTVLYSGAGGDELFNGYTHRYERSLSDVIRRTDYKPALIDYEFMIKDRGANHEFYDWLFLRAVLVVEDRMSGHFTLETRYPFLDNDLVNFALSLPAEYRKDKRILRDVSGLHDNVAYGKKHGFSNPYMSNYDWATFALSFASSRLL